MAAFCRTGFVLLIAIGLSAQTRPATLSPSAQSYRIAGILLNSVTGQPLAAVAVALTTSDGSERDISHTVTTGADGHFSFTGLSRGKYSLMATARGFTLQYFEQHGFFSSAIAVGPDLDSEHLVFRLQPDASLEGEIHDESGEPVDNATVHLFQKTARDGQRKTVPADQGRSDDQGHFHIGHLSPGTYYVAVSARPWYAQNSPSISHRGSTNFVFAKPGASDDAALDVTYPLTFYPDTSDWAAATPVVLHGEERATVDVVLHAVPALHLRIRTGNTANDGSLGRAIYPQVSQRIFEGHMVRSFNTPVFWPEPGVVEIAGLAAGHYVIDMPTFDTHAKNENRGWYQEIDLTADAEVAATNGSEFAAVSGTVVFEGAPQVPTGAWILLTDREARRSFTAKISKQGLFDFKNDEIRAGRYEFALMDPERFFLNRMSASGARFTGRILEVGSASSVRITATASRGAARVNGVALRDDKPFAGALIVLVPQDPANNLPLFRRDQSDSDGTFTLPSVLPGQYTVLAIPDAWDLEWANPTALQPYMKGGTTVRVTGDGEMQIKVQVQ